MNINRSIVALLSLLGTSQAFADGTTVTIHLDTVASNKDVRWNVAEVRAGVTVESLPVFGVETYGDVPALSIPFTDNDGYWVARTMFKLPANAQNPTLSIETLGVDDRAVVGLNGVEITGAGTTEAGQGFMTFQDGGPNLPHNFPFKSGPENLVITTGFRTGFNKFQVITNNTNSGIFGKPVSPGTDPKIDNSFGITATVTYTLPSP